MTYRIKIKRDFGSGPGYWLPNAGDVGTGNYGFVRNGFVVVKGGANCIPGAMWFRTIEDAMRAIKAHINVGGTMAWHSEYARLERSA
jgi:hypothetical protein